MFPAAGDGRLHIIYIRKNESNQALRAETAWRSSPALNRQATDTKTTKSLRKGSVKRGPLPNPSAKTIQKGPYWEELQSVRQTARICLPGFAFKARGTPHSTAQAKRSPTSQVLQPIDNSRSFFHFYKNPSKHARTLCGLYHVIQHLWSHRDGSLPSSEKKRVLIVSTQLGPGSQKHRSHSLQSPSTEVLLTTYVCQAVMSLPRKSWA